MLSEVTRSDKSKDGRHKQLVRQWLTGLLAGISDGLIQKLQSAQNAAAQLVTGLWKFDHTSEPLKELHWLLFRKRITYKVTQLVFKCLNGLASMYLTDDCRLMSSFDRRHLRSSTSGVLYVPMTRTRIGAWSFSVIGPVTWNDLPLELRCVNSSVQPFTKKLKTHLMST